MTSFVIPQWVLPLGFFYAMNTWISTRLQEGLVIPAHPLALTKEGRFDDRYQRGLTRYYHAAGAGGIAVGVHTTQFAIRDTRHGLFKPVLSLAAETIDACDKATGRHTVRIAGIVGQTDQAVREATLARDLGYHVGLLSLSALKTASSSDMLRHVEEVATVIPVCGFYLQPAVGGLELTEPFWREFAACENVVAIKIAPFDRYKTLDVLRGVAASGRAPDIALYTGNDDSIISDLLTRYRIPVSGRTVELDIKGGLLGHWACWTASAVQQLEQCKAWKKAGQIPSEALTLAAEVTDANAAFFDAAHHFKGCIAGIHYVLHRQGLMPSIRCLDEAETLSPGQQEAIDRILDCYPHLSDDGFVAERLEEWLG